jgi:hypothetical protein
LEAFLFYKAKLFRLKQFFLRNVMVKANQTIINDNIPGLGVTVGIHDYPDPAVTYDFYPISRLEH